MRTYLRLSDEKTVIWVIQRKNHFNEEYRVCSGDAEVFAELSAPRTHYTPIYELTGEELSDVSHFESADEQNKMLHAFANLITMAKSDKAAFNEFDKIDFRRCVDYCTGQEVL